jgi:hypothetical protein
MVSCTRCSENVPVNAIAPSARCPKCSSTVAIPRETWLALLEPAVLDGPVAEPGKNNTAPVRTAAGAFVRTYVRKDAACARCNGALPLPRALEHASRGWCICVECGDRVSVRAIPPDVRIGGVTHVIGEDLGGAATAASAGETIQCPRCGSGVAADGSSRAVLCRHCQAQVVIPDAIWARLRPYAASRTFFLWHEAKEVAPAMHLDWDDLHDAVVDRNGNLYFIGAFTDESFYEKVDVWSTDAQLRLRWSRKDIGLKGGSFEETSLVFAPSGHLIVWKERRHGAIVLSCNDGSTVANIGGTEPPGSTAHHLDLEFCTDLACAPDGTLLGLLHDRVLRWTSDGRPIETWPPKKGLFGEKRQKLRPLFKPGSRPDDRDMVKAEAEYPDSLENLGNRPIEMQTDYTHCGYGVDATLVLQRSEHVAKLDPNGDVLWKVTLPERSNDYGRPCIDGWGNVHLIRWLASDTHGVYRISADAKDQRLLVDGTRVGTPVAAERILVVALDCTIYVLGGRGRVRVFGPDGAARFISPKAREEDEYNARKKREREE